MYWREIHFFRKVVAVRLKSLFLVLFLVSSAGSAIAQASKRSDHLDLEKAELADMINLWRYTNETVWKPFNARCLAEMAHLERMQELITDCKDDLSNLGEAKSLAKWKNQIDASKKAEKFLDERKQNDLSQLQHRCAKQAGHYEKSRDLFAQFIRIVEAGDSEKTEEFLNQQQENVEEFQRLHKAVRDKFWDKSRQAKFADHDKRLAQLIEAQFVEKIQLDNGSQFTRTQSDVKFATGTIIVTYSSKDDREISGALNLENLFNREDGKLNGQFPIIRKWKSSLTIHLCKKRLNLDFNVQSGEFTEDEIAEIMTKSTNLKQLDSMKIKE